LKLADVFVFAGPPGSGKGTQAKLLAPRLKVPHISLGDLLREAVRSGTKVGEMAKSYLDAGKLVPDQVAIDVAEEAISKPECRNGFVIDGFPRTLEQGVLFDKLLGKLKFNLKKVLYIDIKLDEILRRLTGRRSCPKCGAVYHIQFNPPKTAGICDVCGGELVQRKDDTEEVIRVRYEVYTKQTAPLIEYYTKAGKIAHIDGSRLVNEVFNEVYKAVAS
jgi:adenylate kinase